MWKNLWTERPEVDWMHWVAIWDSAEGHALTVIRRTHVKRTCVAFKLHAALLSEHIFYSHTTYTSHLKPLVFLYFQDVSLLTTVHSVTTNQSNQIKEDQIKVKQIKMQLWVGAKQHPPSAYTSVSLLSQWLVSLMSVGDSLQNMKQQQRLNRNHFQNLFSDAFKDTPTSAIVTWLKALEW